MASIEFILITYQYVVDKGETYKQTWESQHASYPQITSTFNDNLVHRIRLNTVNNSISLKLVKNNKTSLLLLEERRRDIQIRMYHSPICV